MLTTDELLALKKRVEEGLSAPLPDGAIRQANKGKKGSFTYLSAGYVKARMRDLFGLTYSCTNTLLAHKTEKTGGGDWRGFAVVKATISIPSWNCVREGVGTCAAEGCNSEKAVVEVVYKGAESDAFKRATFGLGETFGLALRLNEDELEALDEQFSPAQEIAHHEQQNRVQSQQQESQAQRESRKRHEEPNDARDDAFDRDLSKPREPARDARPGEHDPDYDELVQSGIERGMAKSLSTLPSREVIPRGVMKEVFDLCINLHGVDTGLVILRDLGINEKRVNGREARCFALATMKRK
jgi:hypothetical protein